MHKTAVIILNWNGTKMMQQFLPSVIHNTEEADIIVADNGSTDDSIEMLNRQFPEITVIPFDRNYGFAEGYNRALQAVEHEYVVLLNSDIETPQGWLRPLISCLDHNPDIVACQPKLLSWHEKQKGREVFEYAGAAGGYLDRFGYPFCRGRIFQTVEDDNGQYDNHDILWATGACMMIRRKDYLEVGGLDPRFFAHNEEIDLCWRLNIMGRRIVCVTQSKVYHVGGGTLPQGNPRKTYLNFRNNLTMLYKNLPDKELSSVMRWRLLLDYVAALQSLLKGNIGDVKAIMRARRDFRAWRPSYAAIRQSIQARATIASPPTRMPYSILVKYYLRGIRTFSRL